MRGARVGQYEVGQVLDATIGMVIYSAERAMGGMASRALMLLSPRPHGSPDAEASFAAGVELFAIRQAPATLPVEAHGTFRGTPFAVSPRLSGVPLYRVLDGLRAAPVVMSDGAAVSVVAQVAAAALALEARARPEHRISVSPDVIWLTGRGEVFLLPTAVRIRAPAGDPATEGSGDDQAAAGGLATELSALLLDLLLMGRARASRTDEATVQVGEVVAPALFQIVLDALGAGPDRCHADQLLGWLAQSSGDHRAHAEELSAIAARAGARVSGAADAQEEATCVRLRPSELLPAPDSTGRCAPPASLCLRIVQGDPEQADLVIDDSRRRWVVGRSPRADLQVRDPSMSREHFSIERGSDGTVWARDLGSKNGLSVNGHRGATLALETGDALRAGLTLFRVETRSDSAEDGDLRAGLGRVAIGLDGDRVVP